MSEEEFVSFITNYGFNEVSIAGTYEKVYDREVDGFIIRVYSSIEKGRARDCGEDAIRVAVLDSRSGNGVMKNKRVHRIQTWKSNLTKRLNTTFDAIKNGEIKLPPLCFIKEHGPMVFRVAKRGKYKGNTFWGCSEWPYCSLTKQINQ